MSPSSCTFGLDVHLYPNLVCGQGVLWILCSSCRGVFVSQSSISPYFKKSNISALVKVCTARFHEIEVVDSLLKDNVNVKCTGEVIEIYKSYKLSVNKLLE